MKIYFDACCLNRPFDDQTQNRIRLETEAIRILLAMVAQGRHDWLSSDVLVDELMATPDLLIRSFLLKVAGRATLTLISTEEVFRRAKSFDKLGVSGQDAVHLSVASIGRCDVFLTVDDRLIQAARRFIPALEMKVINPLNWITEGLLR